MGWANPYLAPVVALAPAATVAVSSVGGSVEVSNDTGNPLPVTDPHLPNELGVWDYRGGASGAPRAFAGRVIGIAAHAPSSAAGSITINGGDAIPVPAGAGIELAPRGNVTSPAIVFTGTDSYMVEFLT